MSSKLLSEKVLSEYSARHTEIDLVAAHRKNAQLLERKPVREAARNVFVRRIFLYKDW
jgi:hypothetical protein